MANERRDIENKNYNKAILKARALNLPYLHVEDPSEGQLFSQQESLDETAAKLKKQDYKDFNNGNVFTFNGGKKRKTHKKRK